MEKAVAISSFYNHDEKETKVKNKKILDEETYSENVERIIIRDFFPDHQHLKDQKAYLEAEEKKDFEKMRQIALKYAAGGTHGNTAPSLRRTPLPSPATFETPLPGSGRPPSEFSQRNEKIPTLKDSAVEEENLGYKRKETKAEREEEEVGEKDKNMSLDKFLTQYTSEDNDSFETIMERSEQARREKHAWLYEAEKRHAEMSKQILQLEGDNSKPLAITDGSDTDKRKSADNISVNNHEDSKERATVPINTWEYKNKNALMYYPEGLDANDDSVFKKPLLIKHENTRFTEDPFKNAANRSKLAEIMNETKNQAGEKVGPDGKSIIPQESPRVGGYGFVATPSLMPGVNESPLMTWGEIESTPARLEATATPGPSFRFPEESEREKLVHKMVDENTKKHRAKKQAALKQMKASVLGTPNRMGSVMSSERISTLSPAARRLVNRKFNLGTDKALKASYTPTPSYRKRIGNETPIAITPTSLRRTPKSTSTPGGSGSDITDNLLNIPNKQRKKASDFF